MPKASVLRFKNYRVEELSFKNTPVAEGQHEFELHPRFEQKIVETGENRYDVHLSVEITSTEEHIMPFSLKAAIVGDFTINDPGEEVDQDVKDNILQRNTVSILFPFLRSIVATVTTTANIPALILPVMNFAEKK